MLQALETSDFVLGKSLLLWSVNLNGQSSTVHDIRLIVTNEHFGGKANVEITIHRVSPVIYATDNHKHVSIGAPLKPCVSWTIASLLFHGLPIMSTILLLQLWPTCRTRLQAMNSSSMISNSSQVSLQSFGKSCAVTLSDSRCVDCDDFLAFQWPYSNLDLNDRDEIENQEWATPIKLPPERQVLWLNPA